MDMAGPVSWASVWRRPGEDPLAAALRAAEDRHLNKGRGSRRLPTAMTTGDRRKQSVKISSVCPV